MASQPKRERAQLVLRDLTIPPCAHAKSGRGEHRLPCARKCWSWECRSVRCVAHGLEIHAAALVSAGLRMPAHLNTRSGYMTTWSVDHEWPRDLICNVPLYRLFPGHLGRLGISMRLGGGCGSERQASCLKYFARSSDPLPQKFCLTLVKASQLSNQVASPVNEPI